MTNNLRALRALAASLLLLVVGCADDGPSPREGATLTVSAAALELATVDEVLWDVQVVAGDPPGVVWERRLASTRFGDGAGSVSYVGPCDAQAGEHSVRLWVVGLYAGDVAEPGAFNAGAATGQGEVDGVGVTFWSPTSAGPLTRTVMCRPNADVEVRFDVTLMRPAQQGFFDVAVNFGDVFCSAKFDCCRDADGDGDGQCAPDGSEDITLLFDDTGRRASTLVLGFACTGGPGGETELYLDPLLLTCDLGATSGAITVDPSRAPGNQCAPGDVQACDAVAVSGDLDPDAVLFQVGVYKGVETLQSGGSTAAKLYWNVALGVRRPAIHGCRLTTRGTADDALATPRVDRGQIGAGVVYPIISWDVPLGACAAEEVTFGDPDAPVSVTYTTTDGAGAQLAHVLGRPPALAWEPLGDPLTMDVQGPGLPATSAPLTVRLVNSGGRTGPLALVIDGAHFALVDDGCTGLALAAGDECLVTVTARASVNGDLSGSLTVVGADAAPLLLAGAATSMGVSFVAVGANGNIRASEDGFSWVNVSVGGDTLQDVAWGDGKWVAVGDRGKVHVSEDGLVWGPNLALVDPPTRADQADRDIFFDVLYAGGQWVAVGGFTGTGSSLTVPSLIYTSPDAQVWTRRDTAGVRINRAVGFNGVAWVTGGGASHVKRSVDGGVTWSMTTLGGVAGIRAVAAHDGVFIIGGYQHGTLMRLLRSTDDGATWTHVTPASAPGIVEGGIFDGARFLMLAGYPNTVWASPDGLAWELVTSLASGNPYDLASNGMAVVTGGVNGVTTDGWATSTPLGLGTIYGVGARR